MALTQDSRRKLTLAQDTARELIELLRKWIQKRKETIRKLREIADEIDNVQENVNITKTVGYTTSILGGIAGAAGIMLTDQNDLYDMALLRLGYVYIRHVVTTCSQKLESEYLQGGLATPLVVGGITAAVAGAATTTGATIVGGLVSKGKLETAQKVLDNDKKLVEEIEKKKVILEKMSTELSLYFNIDASEFFGFLLMSALSRRFARGGPLFQMGFVLIATEAIALTLLTQSAGNVGKGMATALGEVSVKGLARTVGSVLGIALAGAMVVWDFVKLLETINDLSKGSKTTIAEKLRDIARTLEKQTRDIEEMLEKVQKQGEDFETLIKKRFRERLEAISKKGYASCSEAQEVYHYIQAYTTEEWQHHFTKCGGNLRQFVFEVSRVFHRVTQQVEQYQREDEKKRRRQITVIIIAHGRIDTRLMLPVGLYYPTPYMEAVTLYEPWGCAVDATVIYGITANTISISNVSYSGPVYKSSSSSPTFPSDWNKLDRNDISLIPTTTFSPVTVGEGAYVQLMAIIARLQLESDGLVIPYFTGDGKDIFPFPEVPLYVVTTVLGLIGALTETSIKLRVAACLSVPDNDPNRHRGVIRCDQYYVTDPSHDVSMTNSFTWSERSRIQSMNLDGLNKYL